MIEAKLRESSPGAAFFGTKRMDEKYSGLICNCSPKRLFEEEDDEEDDGSNCK